MVRARPSWLKCSRRAFFEQWRCVTLIRVTCGCSSAARCHFIFPGFPAVLWHFSNLFSFSNFLRCPNKVTVSEWLSITVWKYWASLESSSYAIMFCHVQWMKSSVLHVDSSQVDLLNVTAARFNEDGPSFVQNDEQEMVLPSYSAARDRLRLVCCSGRDSNKVLLSAILVAGWLEFMWTPYWFQCLPTGDKNEWKGPFSASMQQNLLQLESRSHEFTCEMLQFLFYQFSDPVFLCCLQFSFKPKQFLITSAFLHVLPTNGWWKVLPDWKKLVSLHLLASNSDEEQVLVPPAIPIFFSRISWGNLLDFELPGLWRNISFSMNFIFVSI